MQKDIKKIANHFGINNQLSKLMEECGELIVASSKVQIEGIEQHSRFNSLVEEIADVSLMIKQIMFLTGITDEMIEDVQESKIDRTIKRYVTKDNNINKTCGNCKYFLHDEGSDSGICGGLGTYRGGRTHWDSTCNQYRNY